MTAIRRLRAPLLAAAAIAGCTTIWDTLRVEPLSPTTFHQQLTEKAQCMHCHQNIARAPAVPHPHYKKCATCHRAEPAG